MVDDGSTDSSVLVVSEYAALDQRFKVFERHRKPKGGPTCRNIGLEKAKGEYVIFLDSDDLLKSFCLERRILKMNHISSDFAVFQTSAYFDNNLTDKYSFTKEMDNYLLAFLSHEIPWHTTSVLWKKDIILKLRGFDERFTRLQDVELHTRALLIPDLNYEVYYKDEADSYYGRKSARIRLVPGLKGFSCYAKYIYPLAAKKIEKSMLNCAMKNHLVHMQKFVISNFERRKGLTAYLILCRMHCFAVKNRISSISDIYRSQKIFFIFFITSYINFEKARRKSVVKLHI